MPVLDVFSGDGYTCSELTAAINLAPYVPMQIGAKNLFEEKGVETLTVQIERKAGKISILPFKPRGSGQTTKRPTEKRSVRTFSIPHIPHGDTLLADSIQNVRKFGTTDRLEAIGEKTNEVLEGLRANHEVTWEYHRAGAIQGLVLDADGTTELDIFDEFEVQEKEVDFELDDENTDVKAKCNEVIRLVQDGLGAVMIGSVECLCGKDFFDALIAHPNVLTAWERWNDGEYLRTLQREGAVETFVFGNIRFEVYRGQVGSRPFIADDVARFYPRGVPGLFIRRNAPADYVEAVNTIGLPIYVKQERMKFDKGIEFESQSNPLMLCTQPEVLVKGTTEIGT